MNIITNTASAAPGNGRWPGAVATQSEQRLVQPGRVLPREEVPSQDQI